ncbi:MAG: hypothetical protein M3144_09100 [Actinomycetota bacterium]|nr:hypothetical protein [Actinomycetota bacterium]
MPKPQGARKVTRVARTGGGRTKRGQTSWLFPTLITVTVIAGTFLIAFSRAQRQPDTSRPRIGDHWHSALAFDICGTFAGNIPDNGQDPLGIHTHGDGVVHTHPFGSQAAGANATLAVFFDTVGAEVSASQIKLPNEEATHRNGQKCGDRTASVITKVWDTRAPTDQGRIVTGDPGDIRLGDNQLITIAFVPEGTEIRKPPTERQLDNLSDVGPAATSTTTPAPSTTSAPATTVPPTTTPPPAPAP